MTIFPGKLLIAAILLLTGASTAAGMPVSYSADDQSIYREKRQTGRPGIPWRILPGEDIRETARLVYPDNPAGRNNLIRAIIRTNPQHFPGGTYQPLAAGTIINFPDLRTIGAYAKPSAKYRQTASAKSAPEARAQPASHVAAKQPNNPLLTQLITQLTHEAETESRELSTLVRHVVSLENQFNEFQTLFKAKIQLPDTPPADAPAASPIDSSGHSSQKTETAAVSKESIQPVEAPSPAAEDLTLPVTGLPPETTALSVAEPEVIAAGPPSSLADDGLTGDTAPLQNNAQPPADSGTPAGTGDIAPESSPISQDTVFLTGILLTLLIVIVMLRSYRKIKERFTHSHGIVTILDEDERRRYEALFLRHNESSESSTEKPSTPSSGDSIAEARALIEQEKTDEAIQTLQKQLAANQQNIPGWLLLFELLYKANYKRDFKKNARRFKRLNQYSDIWMQIQNLGNKLEPNEPLYFDEQKRKEKFFSGASAAE